MGPEQAKRMLLTGDLISGEEAARIGLVLEAPPAESLDSRVEALAARLEAVPRNQLMMQKLMVNQAFENMGLASPQMIATLFDASPDTPPRAPGSRLSPRARGRPPWPPGTAARRSPRARAAASAPPSVRTGLEPRARLARSRSGVAVRHVEDRGQTSRTGP